MGKRRIEIKKIVDKSKMHVCFSKRRKGLFKKAADLCTLCDAQIAIITFSATGKLFSFGHPDADSVVNRYLGLPNPAPPAAAHPPNSTLLDRIFELERRMHLSPANGFDDLNSWDVGSASVEELQQVKAGLEGIRKKVLERMEDISRQSASVTAAASVENMLPLQVVQSQSLPLITAFDGIERFYDQLSPINVGNNYILDSI